MPQAVALEKMIMLAYAEQGSTYKGVDEQRGRLSVPIWLDNE
jgi:hypothetical protein